MRRRAVKTFRKVVERSAPRGRYHATFTLIAANCTKTTNSNNSDDSNRLNRCQRIAALQNLRRGKLDNQAMISTMVLLLLLLYTFVFFHFRSFNIPKNTKTGVKMLKRHQAPKTTATKAHT